MADAVPAAAPMTKGAPRGSRPWVVAAVVVVVLLTGMAVAIAWTSPDDRGAVASAAPSASWMQEACQQWSGTYAGVAPPTSWCASMWSWMQTTAPGMMQMMWWGDPDRFATACIDRTGGGPDAKAWCNAMTTWMQSRASQYGGWGPWMMRPAP